MTNYILTYTKTKFYPLQPVVADIKIEDIAHSLSLMTRANGHFKHFYSVAQHAINCYKEAKARGYSERVQLGCLLHDARESYISDLTRPVKCQLTEYFAIEEKLQRMIYEKYGLGNLSEEEQLLIRNVDDVLLYHEFIALMGIPLAPELPPKIFIEHDFSQRDFINVENEFVYTFNRLTKGKNGFRSVGIDGCRSGWVAVNITDEGFEVELYKSVEEICSKYSDSDSILVDMPIGLPESTEDIRPDTEARGYLSGRTSCIFNTPCRQSVYTEDYFDASCINKQVLGKGLSKQSFAICNQIREIDEMLEKLPEYKEKIKESHPEVCFAILSSEGKYIEPIYESKHTEDGRFIRMRVLEQYYDQTPEFIDYISEHPKLGKIVEDCIDALCLAVTGMLGLKRGFRSIPERPALDRRGLLMQMVYAEKI